jgi:hypothetical protein
VILILAISLAGCQTINVQNGPDASKNYTQDEWHHIGIADLVEYSDPVDLRNRCNGKDWSAVRTRQSVGQVFLGLVPYLGFFWSPREVAIACKE